MNIAEVLRQHAVAHPDRAAIVDAHGGRDRVITFGALEGTTAQAAQLLSDSGLRPGDRVLVLQPMSAELYVALLAIFRLGLVATFVDPSAGMAHVERCCALAQPKALIGSPKAHLLRLLAPTLGRIPLKLAIGAPVPIPGAVPWQRLAACMPHDGVYDAAPDDPALLTFTSGSTGQPKAMVRSHSFLLAQHRVLERNFPSGSGGVSLTTLPIFVLADLASGMTSLIAAGDLRHPGRVEAAPVLDQMERYRPLRASASPAFWERIVAYCRAHGRSLLHVEAIYAGGAPVFPRLLDDLQEIAPQAAVVAVYGSTEAEPIAHIARSAFTPEDVPAMLAGRGLLVGAPVREIELRILRDAWGTPLGPYTSAAFEERCLPPDEPGEIVVSGTHVSGGYLGGEGDEETKFCVDGTPWHRTGDAGYLDATGRLWLLGRCAARIADERGTLYPFAVEAALSAHREIRRSAAVAVGGRRVLALELESPADGTTRDKLAHAVAWAQFDEVRVLRRIPVDRRHNAKIDYPALYRLLGSS